MDDFSDDGFDELNVALLQELEDHAIEAHLTQKPPGSRADLAGLDDHVDRADEEALRQLARVPVQPSFAGRLAAAAAPPPLALPSYSQHSMADVPLPAANSSNIHLNSNGNNNNTSNPNNYSLGNYNRSDYSISNYNSYAGNGGTTSMQNVASRTLGNYSRTNSHGSLVRPPPPRPMPLPPSSTTTPAPVSRVGQAVPVRARPPPAPAQPPPPASTGPRVGMAPKRAPMPMTTTTATATTATAHSVEPAEAAPPSTQQPDSAATIAALQARVRTLETDLYTARGKASIVQEKYEKAQQQHSAELSRIKQQKEEELAKQRQQAEKAVEAHRNKATALEFERHDLQQEVERTRKTRRGDSATGTSGAAAATTTAAGGGANPRVPTTPRKGAAGRSNWNVSDGFDDNELLPSPSKGLRGRLRDAGIGVVGSGSSVPALERTPTKGKRRRPPTSDSPTKPLETVEAMDTMDLDLDSDAAPRPAEAVEVPSQVRRTDEGPLTFLQQVLAHQSHPDEPPTVELFSRFSFPSNQNQTLAFLILQRIPKLEGNQGTTRLMLDFCQLVLGIWSQCLREQYYAPVRALVSLMAHVLSRDPSGLAPHFLLPLLPLAQETIYLVAEPTFNNHSKSPAHHPDYVVRQLANDIDAGAIMALLRLAAYGCLGPSESSEQLQQSQKSQKQPLASLSSSYSEMSAAAQTLFWSHMQFEFVLLILSSKQLPEAFLSMLSLLRTSALPESVGPITNDANRDAGVVTSTLIDRISHHIVEPPKWTASSKYAEWDMRLSALGVLDCFAQSPFGRLGLAVSDSALARLVDAFFSAYADLRDRNLLREPLYPAGGELSLSEDHIRAYGIGGMNGLDLVKPTLSTLSTVSAVNNLSNAKRPGETKGKGGKDGKDGKGDEGDYIPLVLLYVSSVICLVHSIVTDPYTTSVANLPVKLAEAPRGTLSIYLLMMARIGLQADPVFAVGLREETCRLALELFNMAASPEDQKEYLAWAKESTSSRTLSSQPDPFADYAPSQQEEHARADRMVA